MSPHYLVLLREPITIKLCFRTLLLVVMLSKIDDRIDLGPQCCSSMRQQDANVTEKDFVGYHDLCYELRNLTSSWHRTDARYVFIFPFAASLRHSLHSRYFSPPSSLPSPSLSFQSLFSWHPLSRAARLSSRYLPTASFAGPHH